MFHSTFLVLPNYIRMLELKLPQQPDDCDFYMKVAKFAKKCGNWDTRRGTRGGSGKKPTQAGIQVSPKIYVYAENCVNAGA